MTEDMTYDASYLLEDVEAVGGMPERMEKQVYAWSKRLEWGLTDYELSSFARRFIRYVQEGKKVAAAAILYFLEDINYHTEYGDFIDGKAADYIMSSVKNRDAINSVEDKQ